MKKGMEAARLKLQQMLDQHELTRGMYVRVHGDHLIAGREERVGPNGELGREDRVRFTQLGTSTYGLSVKRHTGRWERTPFSGSMKQMVDAVLSFMQHLVASYDA
jgi:hypothetical protein